MKKLIHKQQMSPFYILICSEVLLLQSYSLILWSQIWAFSFLHLKKRFETERPSFDIGFLKSCSSSFIFLACNLNVTSLFHARLTSYHTLKEIIKAKRSETEKMSSETEKIRLETVKRKIFG